MTGSLSEDNAPVFEPTGGICHRCVHYDPQALSCVAFPGGVPAVILVGEFIHTEPYPGDRGIRFQERDDAR